MSLPARFKIALMAIGSALAGMVTAALLLPPTAISRPSPGNAPRLTSSPLGGSAGGAAPTSVQGYLDFLNKAGTPGQQMAAALQLASLTDPDEIRALLDQADRFPTHAAGTLATQTLLKRWLELDPAAALEYSRLHFDKSLAKLLGTYAATRPAEAEAWILTLPSSQTKSDAWQELCAVTASRDPAKAWELLGRSPGYSGADGSYNARPLIHKLTAQDIEGTIARLSSMPTMLLKHARLAICKQLMETDPARGWEWAQEQPNPNGLINNAIEVTLGKNPAQAFTWLASLSAAQRKSIMKEDSYNWGSRDSAGLAAALSGHAGITLEEKKALALRFMNNASWRDPEGGEAFLTLVDEKQLPFSVKNYVKNRAAKTSKAATQAWIAGLPPGPVRTAAEASWKEQQQPTAPVDLSSPASMVSEFKKGSYIQETDPRIPKINASQLGEMMADPGNGSYYSTNILNSLAKNNPAPAAAWLASVPVDAKTGPLGAQFSSTWAQEDPAAAAAWVTSLPAGDLATNAAANVARQYHRYAPTEAQNWLQTLPAGPAREAAAKSMEANP